MTGPHEWICVCIINLFSIKYVSFESISRHLQEVLIYCFHLKKIATKAHHWEWFNKPFTLLLHCIVTGDEKWVHYDNPKRRKSWGIPGHAFVVSTERETATVPRETRQSYPPAQQCSVTYRKTGPGIHSVSQK